MPKIFQKSRKLLQIEKNILSRNTSASSQHFVKIQHREKKFPLAIAWGNISINKNNYIYKYLYSSTLLFYFFNCFLM